MKILKKFSKETKRNILCKIISDFVTIHETNLELDSYKLLEDEDVEKELAKIELVSREFYETFKTCKRMEEIENKLKKLFVERKYSKLVVFKNQELIFRIFVLDLEDNESCLWLATYLYDEFVACFTRRSVIKHFEDSFQLRNPSYGID